MNETMIKTTAIKTKLSTVLSTVFRLAILTIVATAAYEHVNGMVWEDIFGRNILDFLIVIWILLSGSDLLARQLGMEDKN